MKCTEIPSNIRHRQISHLYEKRPNGDPHSQPSQMFSEEHSQSTDLLSITLQHWEGLTQLCWFSLGNQHGNLDLCGLPGQWDGRRRGDTDGGAARRERWWRGDSSYGGQRGRSNPSREQGIHLNEKGTGAQGKRRKKWQKERAGAQRKAEGTTEDLYPALKNCTGKTKVVSKVLVTCSASPGGKLSNLIPPLLLKIIALHAANGFGRLPAHHDHHLEREDES